MRQAWKGMVVGAITGAAIGIAMDALEAASRGARAAAGDLREQAPATTNAARELADRASDRIRASEMSDRAHRATARMSDKFAATRAALGA